MSALKSIAIAAIAAVALLACPLGSPAVAEPPVSPPNIVLIFADDLGWRDLQNDGGEWADTPHTTALAAQGLTFTRAYASAPVCSPTRASLLTGQHPARHGFTAVAGMPNRMDLPMVPAPSLEELPADALLFPKLLAEAGYATVLAGKWHLGGETPEVEDVEPPLRLGFTDFLGEIRPMEGEVDPASMRETQGYHHFFPFQFQRRRVELPGASEGDWLGDALTRSACDFIREHRDGPFFVELSHYLIHSPLEAPAELIEKYRAKIGGEAGEKQVIAAAMIELFDDSVGRVMETLDELGLAENTILIVTSDNGGWNQASRNEPLRGGKANLYEGGVRVPLIVRWPGHAEPGSRTDARTLTTDFFPTFLEAAGVAMPDAADHPLDGVSLLPVLEGDTDAVERGVPLFWFYPHHHVLPPHASLLDGDFKFLHFFGGRPDELYDLDPDPIEQQNLAPQRPDIASRMRQRLLAALGRMNASLPHPRGN